MLDRTPPPSALRLALCAVILAGGGCSYVFVDGPPKNHAQLPYFECSSSKAWPVIDTVMAATLGIAAGAAFVDGDVFGHIDRERRFPHGGTGG